MYKFIYYFHYRLAERKNPSPSSFAAGGVLIAQIVHLGLIYIILQKIFGQTFIQKTNSLSLKLMIAPLILFWYILLNIYYNLKRREKIIKKFEMYNIGKTKKIVLILIYMLLPVIFIFVLGYQNK